MPYNDIEKQHEFVRQWKKAHPARVQAYRRTSMLKNAIKQKKMPRVSTMKHHALTKEEVLQLVSNLNLG